MRIHHVALRVADCARAADFYTGLLRKCCEAAAEGSRRTISTMLDGTFRQPMFMDSSGSQEGLARIMITVRKQGDRMSGDLSGSSPELPSGRKVTGAAEFFIGAADMPLDPPKDWQPKSLKGKIAAGAQFAQTQFCMDIEIVKRYVARLAKDRLTDKISLLIGVVPLRSGRSARWIKEQLYGAIIPDDIVERLEYSGDAAAEGKQICIDFIAQLAEVPGVAGAHVMAPNNEGAIPDVIAKARKLVKNRALAS